MTYYVNKMGNMFPDRPKKSLGQQIAADMVLILILTSVFLIIGAVLQFLFRPFFKEADDFTDAVEKKRENRKARNDRFALVSKDPLNQFYARFIKSPEVYQGDPDNPTYKSWFEDLRMGKIIDSTLRWVPEVLTEENTINPAFINYMKIQFELHRKAGFLARVIFIYVIGKFYPELSADMSELERDLIEYGKEFEEKELEEALTDELIEYDLPEDIARSLIKGDINKKRIEFAKEMVNKGYSVETCIYALEKGVEEPYIRTIDVVVKKTGYPARIGHAIALKEITLEDLQEMGMLLKRASDKDIDSLIEEYRGKNIMTSIKKG